MSARISMPARAKRGEVIEIRTIVGHTGAGPRPTGARAR